MDRFIKTDTENVGADALAAYGATPPKRFKTLVRGMLPEAGTVVTKDGAEVGVSPRRPRARGSARSGSRSLTPRSRRTAPRSRPGARSRPSTRVDPQKQRPRGEARPRQPDRPAYPAVVSEPIYGVVPNFSEGRRADVMDAICDALAGARRTSRLSPGRRRPQPARHDRARLPRRGPPRRRSPRRGRG